MPFFERQKARIHYEIHEGLVDHDVVAIHGNLASNAWWSPVLSELRKGSGSSPSKKGRFIAAEWRGCGGSRDSLRTEDDLNLPALADDYSALLRHLGAGKTSILAHSTGGLIALYAMRRSSELYARALLLDPVCATGVQFAPEMYKAFTAMSQDRALCGAVITATISKTVSDQAFLEDIVDASFGVNPLIWHGVPRMLHVVDFRSELPYIRQPVLVLHGENDQILDKAGSAELARGLPHGKFVELAGRGHSTNIEDPALLVSHMRNFLFG